MRSAARPILNSWEPPFSIVPEISSRVPALGVRRPRPQEMPLPHVRSASRTAPVMRTVPVMGLFQPIATPVVGDGWTERLPGGRSIVLKRTGWLEVLTTTLGVSGAGAGLAAAAAAATPGAGGTTAGRRPLIAGLLSIVSTGVVSSASGPVPVRLTHCRRAKG